MLAWQTHHTNEIVSLPPNYTILLSPLGFRKLGSVHCPLVFYVFIQQLLLEHLLAPGLMLVAEETSVKRPAYGP